MDSTSLPGPDSNAEPFEDLRRLPFLAAKTQLVRRFERQYISQLLLATGGNVAEAARMAGVDRGTVLRVIRRLGHAPSGGSTASSATDVTNGL